MLIPIKRRKFDPLIDYFKEKEHDFERNSDEFIARFNRGGNFFEEIYVTFNDGFYLSISNKIIYSDLLFFKDFKFKNNNKKIIENTFRSLPLEISELINFLDFYFYYRDMFFDIQAIAVSGKIKKIKYQYNINLFFSFLFDENKKSKNFIKINDFPQIDNKTGKNYLSKIKNLTKYIPNGKIVLVKLEKNNTLPVSFSFFNNCSYIDSFFCILGPGIAIKNFNQKTYRRNSKISFIMSYLNFFNLFDEFYLNVQKEVLSLMTEAADGS